MHRDELMAVGAGEVGEDAPAADLAAGARGGGRDLGPFVRPHVKRQETTAHEVSLAGEVLEGLGDLFLGGHSPIVADAVSLAGGASGPGSPGG